MTHRLTAIGNTQNKTETLSNKVILIYYKHIGNPEGNLLPREHGFRRQQVDRSGKSSAVTEASQQRTVSVSFC